MKGLIEAIEKENLKDSVPAFNVGDTVKVSVKVVEGTRERLQAFEGVVIAKKNGGIRETFTVRRLSYGVGVERTFPVHSPKIADITVIRKGKVRRAKLYYLLECDKSSLLKGSIVPLQGEYLTSSESGKDTFYLMDFTNGIVAGGLSKRYARAKLRLFYLF